MSEVAEVIDISTRSALRHSGTVTGLSSYLPENATLAILPLHAKHEPVLIDWVRARQRLGQIAGLQHGWNGADGVAPDAHTVSFAAQQLAGLERLGIPAPTVNPSADGSVYAEWHLRGMDIEIIFEAPYNVIVLVEDARHDVPSYSGEHADLTAALEALKALCAR